MNVTWADILEWPRVSWGYVMSRSLDKESLVMYTNKYRGRKPSHEHTCMHTLNPSTSAKSVRTKLQNLFIALVNIDTFR